MKNFEKYICEINKSQEFVEDQINLTSRSDETVSRLYCRAHSAAFSRKAHFEHMTESRRPKSAEYNNSKKSRRKLLFQGLSNLDERSVGEKSSVPVSHFTDVSSRLLKGMLEIPSELADDVTSYGGALEKQSTDPDKEENVVKASSTEECPSYLLSHYPGFEGTAQQKTAGNEMEERNSGILRIQQSFPVVEEKCKFKGSPTNEKTGNNGSDLFHRQKNVHFCKYLKLPYEESHICPNFKSPLNDRKAGFQHQRRVGFKEEANGNIVSKMFTRDTTKSCGDVANTVTDVWLNPEKPLKGDLGLCASEQTAVDFFCKENELRDNSENIRESKIPREEECETHKILEIEEKAPCKVFFPRAIADSTYDEMVHLLQALEEEDSDDMNSDEKGDSRAPSLPIRASQEEKTDQMNVIYSYLEEVERDDDELAEEGKELRECSKNFSSTSMLSLGELLNSNPVELAHEVLSLKIQSEDQRKGIKLLRETLREMKEARKTADIEHQETLSKANAEADALLQRHQKFIKQLLKEKKTLNETVGKLVEDLKVGEERYKRGIKLMEEKHLIEVKKAKEAQAVTEKIKREKWMESKTQKIKEMTVKGLEPELSRMATRQQEEMAELRNLHRAELEAVQLRAARRTSELMDQLRVELMREKEVAIARETATLRASMENGFDEEKNKLQKYCQSLKDKLRREEEKFSNREKEFRQILTESKQEAEKEKQRIIGEHQQELEGLRRRHSVEIKNLREELEADKEIWVNNYKKQECAKFFEKEAELHQHYKRERDRDIEMIIEALEKESAQVQWELNVAGENKLKRLKDKMEAEIKEIETSEAELKDKLSEAKSQLLAKEDFVAELNSQTRQMQGEIDFLRKAWEEMTTERKNLKEVIREEFERSLAEAETEKKKLKNEILCLSERQAKELSKKDEENRQATKEVQKEFARVCTRFKAVVRKKEEAIEVLKKEMRVSHHRCQELERMLDRQRRNLLL